MGRKRKAWSHTSGTYGSTVRIYEPRPGGALRFDYRDADGERRRPQVDPPAFVRPSKDSPVDPILEQRAKDLAEAMELELRGRTSRSPTTAETLTVGEAWRLYFAGETGFGQLKSRSSRGHMKGSRDFWTRVLGADTLWNDVTPDDVWGGVLRLRGQGKTPTARKRFTNLRTLYRWLHEKRQIKGLEDPTLGLETKEVTEGHQPRRPRYTQEEIARLRKEWRGMDPRFRLYMTILVSSGPRGVQVREAERSGLDVPLEPPPRKDAAPHGWIVLPGVKRQKPMVIYLSAREREEIDRALEGYLAEWEEEYQEGELDDYFLIPGGRLDSRGELINEPISNTALTAMLRKAEKRAKVEHKPWRGMHGFRRSWVDLVDEKAGTDTATAAGGWSGRDMVEGVYVSPRRDEHLERARKIKEEDDDGA